NLIIKSPSERGSSALFPIDMPSTFLPLLQETRSRNRREASKRISTTASGRGGQDRVRKGNKVEGDHRKSAADLPRYDNAFPMALKADWACTGVRGRIVDLCKPIARKYETAVSVILGRNIDAIVVDEEKTAIDCIEVL